MWRRVGRILVWTSALISIASAGLFVLSWVRPSVVPCVFGRTVVGAGVDRGALMLGFSYAQFENRWSGPGLIDEPVEALEDRWFQSLAKEQLGIWLRHKGWHPCAVGQAGMDYWLYIFKIRVVAIPLIALAALTAIAPSVVFWRRRRHRRRISNHLCLTCGYDLRHSTERCPECGTPVPGSSELSG